MLAELREQFLAEFVATARSRIKTALALLPPVGPGGERSAETREKRTRDGIPLAPALLQGLDRVADELGLAKLA